LILNSLWILKSAKFWKAHVKRHLTTLETCANSVTSMGTFATATRGFTFGGFTATFTSLLLLSAWRWTEMMHL
jgi:hypothetical protein